MITSPVQVTSESRAPNEDTNVWKVGSLAILFAASGLLTVTRLQALMSAPAAGRIWFALAAFVAFGVLGILMAIIVKHRSVLAASALAACLLPIVGFASRFTGAEFPTVLVVGFAAYTILVVRALTRGSASIRNSVEIRFFGIARTVLPRLTTAVMLFGALLLYLNYAVWGGLTPELRDSAARALGKSSDPVLHLWFSGASFSMERQEFFRAAAAAELERRYPKTVTSDPSELSDGFRSLPPAEQERFTAEAAKALEVSFERFTGPLDDSMPMSSAIAIALERYMATLPPSAAQLLGITLALLLFGTLKSIAALTYWIVEGIAFFIFKILVLVGFAKVSIEMRPHEFVSVP